MNAIMGKLYWSGFVHMGPALKKVFKFSKFLAGNQGKSWSLQWLTFLMFGSLACFFGVIGFSFFYILSSSEAVIETNPSWGSNINVSNGSLSNECNVFDGDWVVDESYPLYNASHCPFLERGFDCLANGRRDKDYLKWRWKPKSGEIPRFDVQAILELLQGKRVVFVGDSLSRTQWESMICMLMSGIHDRNSVYEVNGNEITKQMRHLSVHFRTFNFTVEFYRSVFLVQPGRVPRNSPKRVRMVLKLDKIDDISREWNNADVLVFNTGHWWSATKLFEMGSYFQIGGKIKLGMPIANAFNFALATWQSWIENTVNPKKTQVFFRTFESTHWSTGSRKNCKVTTHPSLKAEGRQHSSISDAIITAVQNLSIPVKLLHVTPMGAFRSDAHVGSWSDNPLVPDCSHWCLPGVPDMWNELLFLFLLSHNGETLYETIEEMIARGRRVRCLWVYAPESESCSAFSGILREFQKKLRHFHQSSETLWLHIGSIVNGDLVDFTKWKIPMPLP